MAVDLSLLVLTLALFAWVGFRARPRRGVAHAPDGASAPDQRDGLDEGDGRGEGDDLDDYVTARDSQGPTALGLSFLASGVGAWILFAPPEVGAFVGAIAVGGYAVGAAAPFLLFALLGGRIRRIVPRGHGLTGFLGARFGRVFRGYAVGLSALYMLVFVAAELTAVGAVAATVAGIDARVAVVAVAAVTLAYTAYGGLRASLRTDAWQAWIVLALLAIGGVVLVTSADVSLGELRGTGLLGATRVGAEAAATLIIAVTAANLFHQGYWQRVWAARDLPALRRGAGLGAAATLPVLAVAGLFGLLAAGSGAGLGDPPAPFFALAALGPGWLGSLVLVLGVALVASSVDTLENGLAALAVSEYPRLTVPAARLLTVLLVIPALVVAFQGVSVLRLFLVADLLCAATVVPAMLGLWSRATGAGALSGSLAGLVGAVVPGWVSAGSLTEGLRAASFPGGIPTLAPFAGALAASALVGVVVSLAAGRTTDLAEVGARVPVLRSPS